MRKADSPPNKKEQPRKTAWPGTLAGLFCFVTGSLLLKGISCQHLECGRCC